MPHLFSKIRFRDIEVRNRIMVSPMCQYSSEDGFANDWHLVHLGSRAVGGAGIVMSEATAVSREGRITPGCLGIWKDDHIPFLGRITDFLKSQGAVPAIQLAHAGRKASKSVPWEGNRFLSPEEGGWEDFVGPGSKPFLPDEPAPNVLDTNGVKELALKFRDAARRALEAGFQIIEIHAAHGYLLNSFLSPLANDRTDEYGGSFENRCRFLMEVIESVWTFWPQNYPLFVRISATDWVEEEASWTIDDSVRLAGLLKGAGVDLVDCSSGGMVPYQKPDYGPGFQTPFAARIKQEAGIKTGAVGFITAPEQADQIIRNGQADLVLLAREFLRNPYFPQGAARQLGHDLDWPVQYVRAKK